MADEEHGADFQPLVNLPEVEVKTGEDDEVVTFKMRSKLYVFVAEDVYGGEVRQNFWRERGTGDVKLLKHKVHGKVRLLMRQEKTLKICANHLVSPTVELNANVGSDRSWVFTAQDFAEEKLETQTFAIKFGNSENAQKFKDALEEAKAINGAAAGAGDDDDDSDPEADDDDDEEGAALDAAIEKRNQASIERRNSQTLLNAQADSDHDSDEEDVDEGNADRLAKTMGVNPPSAAGDDLAANLSGLKVGGYKSRDVNEEDVKAAAAFAVEHLGKRLNVKFAGLEKIEEASSQTVAGLNFKLVLHVRREGAGVFKYDVVVFRPLPHTGMPMELKEHLDRGEVSSQ